MIKDTRTDKNPILGAPYRILWPVTDGVQLAPRVDMYALEHRGVEYQFNEWVVYKGIFILGIYTSELDARPDSRGMITLTLVSDPVIDDMLRNIAKQ